MLDPMLNAMRLMQANNGEQPDQVPVFLPIESGFMAEYGGVPQREYHNDPIKMLECQAKAQERFGGLSPLYTDFGLSSGGVIDRGTPPENIDALVEASEKFGKY